MKNKSYYMILSKKELNVMFKDACAQDDLGEVKYLLTSPDLKEYADIHDDNDYGFKLACFKGYLNIIKFLIFDINIKKTEQIEKYLTKNPNEQVKNMFKIRELNKRLNNELKSDNIINKKIKL